MQRRLCVAYAEGMDAIAVASGIYRAVVASAGAVGAADDATWRPTLTVWPGAGEVAQPEPVHVILTPDRVHVIPQELTMEVAPGESQATVHPATAPAAVTVTSAT